jgi:ABC-2 type transport system permease protein
MSAPAASSGWRMAWRRLGAVFRKEFIQMRRDRMTFGFMVLMPVIQLLLFGYAINNDPRHMPAAVQVREEGVFARDFLAGLANSSYFDIVATTHSDAESERLMRSGKVAFLIEIPEGFETKLVRGERPQILVAADATDPVAAGGAVGAVGEIAKRAFARDLEGALAHLDPQPAPFEIVVHRRYNPEGATAFNIVPGLLGIILTMTLTLITSIALTREAERGTLETLLATPVRPAEVMIGKVTPYILVGGVQTILVLIFAQLLFQIPFRGSLILFSFSCTIYIVANLCLGYLISTVARTQMQAMQATFMVFLPSMLLSGFMFPFRAMPGWAQAIGEAIPITHFLRVVRELFLKAATAGEIWPDVWPLLVMTAVLAALALMRFRRTLD